jgi:ribosomal protein S18 acetylase RimI-like enzyme
VPSSPGRDPPSPAHAPTGVRRDGRGAEGEGSPDIKITILSAIEAEAVLYPLSRLLEDAVAGGASIGFLHPMAKGEALAYWKSFLSALRSGETVLLVAKQGGRIVGAVQLNLETRPNANHRANISKLMVLTSARRGGIGRALMLAAENEAHRLGRTTLVLHTRVGDPSEALCRSLGWQRAGLIPEYARRPDGNLNTTAFYYKLLGE